MFAVERILYPRIVELAVKQQKSFAASVSSLNSKQRSYRVVVVGGGTSGCAVASKLASRFGKGSVAILEPSDVSFYREERLFTAFRERKKADEVVKMQERRCK